MAEKKSTKQEIDTKNLYYIVREETEYYFGSVRDQKRAIFPVICIGLSGVKKFFKTELDRSAKIVSSIVAEYPLYEKECGIKIKIRFVAQKVTELYG